MNRVVCLGILVKDIVFRVPRIPSTPQKLTCSTMRMQFGGMAATASAAAAALGAEVAFWGRIGDDGTHIEALRALRNRGVEPHLKVTPESSSPMSAVIVDDSGERMLAVYTGQLDANADWLPLKELSGVGAVHADFRWMEGARALFKAAQSLGIPRVLDADAGGAQSLQHLIPLSDHVIFSERGLKDYVGDLPLEQSLRQIARVNGAVVGVTLGEKGSLFCHNDQLQAIPAALIVPVDTNGAGDVYHGAYAVALARGLPWVEAARYAGAAASLKCTRIHEWANLPSHEEVAAFMEKHPC